MSKLARTLALAAMLAAMNLAAVTAVAQAQAAHHPTSQDATRPPTKRQVDAQQQTTADATVQRLLAQERAYTTWGYANPAVQQALAQERSYSTSGYGDTSPPAPAAPGGRADRLVPTLGVGVLATVLALVTLVAVLAARRATRTRRASQTA